MYGSKFHRRFLSAAPGIAVPITAAQPVISRSFSPVRSANLPAPRFQVDKGEPVIMPPKAEPAKENFWDGETFGISNKIVAPVGAAIVGTVLYKLIF